MLSIILTLFGITIAITAWIHRNDPPIRTSPADVGGLKNTLILVAILILLLTFNKFRKKYYQRKTLTKRFKGTNSLLFSIRMFNFKPYGNICKNGSGDFYAHRLSIFNFSGTLCLTYSGLYIWNKRMKYFYHLPLDSIDYITTSRMFENAVNMQMIKIYEKDNSEPIPLKISLRHREIGGLTPEVAVKALMTKLEELKDQIIINPDIVKITEKKIRNNHFKSIILRIISLLIISFVLIAIVLLIAEIYEISDECFFYPDYNPYEYNTLGSLFNLVCRLKGN
jgi:hypothetical protein